MAGSNLAHALDYLKAGYSVIPTGPDKKPLVSWKAYQERCATEDEIKTWPAGSNLAVATGKISGITVFDFDSQEALDYFLSHFQGQTPCVDTPRGMHAWFKYEEGVRNSVKINGLDIDVRGDGGYVIVPPSVNAQGKGYKWLQSPFDVPLAPVPDFLKESIASNNNSFSLHTRAREEQNGGFNVRQDSSFFVKGNRDNGLFHVANCLAKGGCETETISEVLEILAQNCNPPFPEREIAAKIKSALDRAARRERNLAQEVEDFINSSSGVITSSEIVNFLQISSLTDKKNISQILRRLSGPGGIIERTGTKNGCWRKVDTTIELMNWWDADPNDTVNLVLPLDIHRKTKIFPKSAIVLGGVSGMGKTLFTLNVINDNMNRMPVYYFNSEMSPQQLSDKISYFLTPKSAWKEKMHVVDNWDFNNIADKIQPDALNCIDYLEPEGERPYMIHGVISAIIRKLNRGVALICVQKKPGAKLATGGIYSIKAASLALALDWGRIEIVKNRNREADKSPTLNTLTFDVKGGYLFSAKGGWHASE